MNTNEISEFYLSYIRNKRSIQRLENDLFMDVDTPSLWVEKLKSKSAAIREIFVENEKGIEQCIRQYAKEPDSLSDEIIDEFLNAIEDLISEGILDYQLTCEILKIIIEVLEKKNSADVRLVRAYYYMAVQIRYMSREDCYKRAVESYDKLVAFVLEFTDAGVCETGRLKLSENAGAKKMLAEALADRVECFMYSTDFTHEGYFMYYAQAEAFYRSGLISDIERKRYAIESYEKKLVKAQWHRQLTDFTGCTAEQKRKYLDISSQKLGKGDSIFYAVFVCNQYFNSEKTLDECFNALYKEYCKNVFDLMNVSEDSDNVAQIVECYMQRLLELVDKTSLPIEKQQKIREKLIEDLTDYLCQVSYGENDFHVDECLAGLISLVLESQESSLEGIEHFLHMLTRRQISTAIHSLMVARIAKYVMLIMLENHPGYLLNTFGAETLSEVEKNRKRYLDYIYKAAILHDIGKLFHKNVINQQSRKITDEEFASIKRHCSDGATVLLPLNGFEAFCDVVLGHHKTYDGEGGYPYTYNNTTSKYKIFIDIISICDSIDAATDILGRNYTVGKNFSRVLEELKAGSGKRYSADIVNMICESQELMNVLEHITTKGREMVYLEVYSDYVRN